MSANGTPGTMLAGSDEYPASPTPCDGGIEFSRRIISMQGSNQKLTPSQRDADPVLGPQGRGSVRVHGMPGGEREAEPLRDRRQQ